LRCREHPFIRAERLEELVWGEVRRVLQDPDLIAAGLAALDPDEDTGEADDAARTERELAGVQAEEDRAIRLYVSGKISEQQLDHQRRFIGERLERLRAPRRAPGEDLGPGRPARSGGASLNYSGG
ncbi:MAG: hypothetical protein OXF41_18360, partial [bacterium]|nr:hypothetical protein [bacterium]